MIAGLVVGALVAQGGGQGCPAAEFLPQLTIDRIEDSPLPVMDDWQVFWGDVPMSDAQLAILSQDDVLLDRTREEMHARGAWVYLGMLMASGGTAMSSAGWVLYGQDNLPQKVTLPIALGGLAIGVAGMLVITESIQRPLEPYLAPTPLHRLSRQEVRELVAQVNRRLHREICEAAQATEPAPAN